MSSNRRYHTLVYKGTRHHSLKKEGWHYPWLGDMKFAKKEARRAQRRDGHKEIRDVVAYYTEEIALVNMFSPIPIWLMSENERLGMEHWRQMKSDVYLLRRRKAQQAEDYKDYYYLSWERFTEEEPTCDETLFEDLKRSTKK